MENYYTYALYNLSRDKIYIGHTSNLTNRLARHNKKLKTKKTSFTYKNSGTWELVYSKTFKTRAEAIRREKELKSYKRREFVREEVKQKIRNLKIQQ